MRSLAGSPVVILLGRSFRYSVFLFFFEGGRQLIPTPSNPIPAWLCDGETDMLIGLTCLIKDCDVLQG